MTDHDVAVATPSEEANDVRPDRSLAEQLVDQARADGRSLVGPGGLLSDLAKQVLETVLEVEMEEHLGYPKHAVEGRDLGNSRNGTRSKTVITEIGPVEVDVPRDRDGSFDPATVRKGQRRLDGVDSMVISLTAKGLTTGEVEAHLAEVYSTSISRETIFKITDRVLEGLAEWQNRPLDRVYPVIFIDAIVVKIRDGQVANRPVYTAIGANPGLVEAAVPERNGVGVVGVDESRLVACIAKYVVLPMWPSGTSPTPTWTSITASYVPGPKYPSTCTAIEGGICNGTSCPVTPSSNTPQAPRASPWRSCAPRWGTRSTSCPMLLASRSVARCAPLAPRSKSFPATAVGSTRS